MNFFLIELNNDLKFKILIFLYMIYVIGCYVYFLIDKLILIMKVLMFFYGCINNGNFRKFVLMVYYNNEYCYCFFKIGLVIVDYFLSKEKVNNIFCILVYLFICICICKFIMISIKELRE